MAQMIKPGKVVMLSGILKKSSHKPKDLKRKSLKPGILMIEYTSGPVKQVKIMYKDK